MTLIPAEELQASRKRYLREHPEDRAEIRRENARRAKVLIEVATEDPSLTVAQLADYAERKPAWVRRTLKTAGIALEKPVGLMPAPQAKPISVAEATAILNEAAAKSQGTKRTTAQPQMFWATRAHAQADSAAPQAEPAAPCRFVYQVRSFEQWEARMKPSRTRQARRRQRPQQ
jgi:hypothetical protein